MRNPFEEITGGYLKSIGFVGAFPNGEYYLYDESVARPNGWCCVMCVYPIETKEQPTASYNGQRGMWCDNDRFFDSGKIELESPEHLQEIIRKSLELKVIEHI